MDVVDASQIMYNSYLYQFQYDRFISQRATYFAINKIYKPITAKILSNFQYSKEYLAC